MTHTTARIPSPVASGRTTLLVCIAAMISLAVAMGIGRFAFTPLLPLMTQDGLLTSETGALVAAANYLGYLVGALLAGRVPLRASTLVMAALISTVLVTMAVGWTESIAAWAVLRFAAGVFSAWALVATTAWGLGWLAALGRPHFAGTIFAGVGLGIAAAGLFCLIAVEPGVSSLALWIQLGMLTGIVTIFPLITIRRLPVPMPISARGQAPTRTSDSAATTRRAGIDVGGRDRGVGVREGIKEGIRDGIKPPPHQHASPGSTTGLTVCYTLFGLGYILPATYLPALAQQLVADPKVFGMAWPLFGAAAALSTIIVAYALKNVSRLRIWAVSQLIMTVGVVLPVLWASLISVSIAAMLVGGTFVLITMLAMQEARARGGPDVAAVLGKMTAGFALGQLVGPLFSALLARFTADFSTALNLALLVSAAGLLFSSAYLWREARA